MAKLNRWTIYYPSKTEDAKASKDGKISLKEHWACLEKNALENCIIDTSDDKYKMRHDEQLGETAYLNDLISIYMEKNIPLLEYIEIDYTNEYDNFYLLHTPSDLSLLTKYQKKELLKKIPFLKNKELKSKVLIEYYTDGGLIDETNLETFSTKLYNSLYGNIMDMSYRIKGRRR